MNKQYDIIIIGDSPDGFKALKALAAASQTIKIAYVSREFKSTTTRDFLNVEYIKDELVLVDYRTQLFGCYLKSGDRLYSTHIIVASGLKYAPYYVNGKAVPNVFNTPYDISKAAKNLPAVVVGRDTRAIKLAIAVAKKYRHVYLCMDTINPSCSTALKEKIEAITKLIIKDLVKVGSSVQIPVYTFTRNDAGEEVERIVELLDKTGNPTTSTTYFEYGTFTHKCTVSYLDGKCAVNNRGDENCEYQIKAGSLEVTKIITPEYNKIGIPAPDKVIFLDMPVEFAQQLMRNRKNKIDSSDVKDIHESNIDFQGLPYSS